MKYIKDSSRPGRPTEIDTDKIKVLVDKNLKKKFDMNDGKKINK